jgi:hypothetical protein
MNSINEPNSSARGVPMFTAPEIRDWWSYGRLATWETTTTPVRVPMSDGVELDCDLTRPSRGGLSLDGLFPGLVVELTPYAAMRGLCNLEAAWFAARGYVALVGNIRGTGESAGEWMHAMSSQDGRDARDLVEWLAMQPFCDGQVGQLGESYGGQTTYGAAVERPPHLRASTPMQSPGNLYDDVIYPGGIKTTEGGTIDRWPPGAAIMSQGRIDADDEYATNRSHPTFDGYWQDRALVGRVADIEVPVLAVGGWKDEYFRSGALALMEGLPQKTWCFYGQWPHMSPVSYEDPPKEGSLPGGVLLAWFDRWLRDDTSAPVPDNPTFVSFEGPERVGAGWRLLPGWSAEGRAATTWLLGADGALTEDAVEGTVTIHQPAEPLEPGAACTFVSGVLRTDRVLVGWPILRFDAILSAGDAHYYVELLDVAADGTEFLVTNGFLKASHRRSHRTPEPVPPRKRETYTVKLRADHWRFVAGHRVRLRLSGASSSMLSPVPQPVDIELFTGPTATLRLPGFSAPDPDA